MMYFCKNVYGDNLMAICMIIQTMIQLRWNNYYFIQNSYFDDKMKIFEQFEFGTK